MLGRDDACSVTEIADRALALDLSVVSRHLGTLRNAGLVKAERRGRQVFYKVDGAAIAKTLHALADAIESCCAPAAAPARGGK
jgi:DNA-binding transcriptional ArsR family regulator